MPRAGTATRELTPQEKALKDAGTLLRQRNALQTKIEKATEERNKVQTELDAALASISGLQTTLEEVAE